MNKSLHSQIKETFLKYIDGLIIEYEWYSEELKLLNNEMKKNFHSFDPSLGNLEAVINYESFWWNVTRLFKDRLAKMNRFLDEIDLYDHGDIQKLQRKVANYWQDIDLIREQIVAYYFILDIHQNHGYQARHYIPEIKIRLRNVNLPDTSVEKTTGVYKANSQRRLEAMFT